MLLSLSLHVEWSTHTKWPKSIKQIKLSNQGVREAHCPTTFVPWQSILLAGILEQYDQHPAQTENWSTYNAIVILPNSGTWFQDENNITFTVANVILFSYFMVNLKRRRWCIQCQKKEENPNTQFVCHN
jgi:DMSO/TMAO reductase YedYZ molybdopterin-dependent catalytic subunit